MTQHPADLLSLQDAAQHVGELQGRIRLADSIGTPAIRDALNAAAEVLDGVDERLTQAFCELAPAPEVKRRNRAA